MKLAFIQCLVRTQICPKAFCFKIFVHMCAQSPSYVHIFVTPWTVASQTPLSMEFSRQEYWRGLPFPTPGDLSNSEIEPASFALPTLADIFLTTAPSGKLPSSLVRTL